MTGELLVRALGADVPAGTDHILDAALELAAASGLRHLTMEDVARRAGIGRMTVYRRFGTREALLDALAGREVRRCLAELDAAAPVDAPLEEQVVAGFTTAMRLIREHPLLDRLARVEPGFVLSTLAADDGTILKLCSAFLAGRLRESQRSGVVGAAVDVEETAELIVRVAFSFVLIPATALPLEDPELARRLFAPLLQDGTRAAA